MNSARHRDMIYVLGIRSTEFRRVRFSDFGPQPLTDRIATFEHNVWFAGQTTHAVPTLALQLQSGTCAGKMRRNASALAPTGAILARIMDMNAAKWASEQLPQPTGMRIFDEIHDAQGITEIDERKRAMHELVTKSNG